MKVLTLGRELSIINQQLESVGLTVVDKDPDIIVTHGGDGQLLRAEHQYPGIPKLAIRYNSICKMCVDHNTAHLIKMLSRNELQSTEIAKLTTSFNGQTFFALNEFSIHHVKPNQAVRFSVQINDEKQIHQAIGDGLVVATPFGSHAYYRSITNSTFRLGIGVAFNNSTEAVDHLVVKDTDIIKVTITRGPAYLLIDNHEHPERLEAGDSVVIEQSDQTARILGIDHLLCPDCGELMRTVGADLTT